MASPLWFHTTYLIIIYPSVKHKHEEVVKPFKTTINFPLTVLCHSADEFFVLLERKPTKINL